MLVLFVLLSLIIPSNVFAEPSPAINFLNNDPVSMLDWGIYNLNKYLENKIIVNGVSINLTIYYDWDTNRIILSSFTKEVKDISAAKQMGKELFNIVRDKFYIDLSTGKPLFGYNILERFFSHEGYVKKSKPENLVQELTNITELDITIPILGDKIFTIRCKGRLFSNEIYISED